MASSLSLPAAWLGVVYTYRHKLVTSLKRYGVLSVQPSSEMQELSVREAQSALQ